MVPRASSFTTFKLSAFRKKKHWERGRGYEKLVTCMIETIVIYILSKISKVAVDVDYCNKVKQLGDYISFEDNAILLKKNKKQQDK